MANIKSKIKRIGTNEKSRLRNVAVKSELKTHVRKVREAIAAGDKAAAEAALKSASIKLDKASSKGVIHENQAANRKSALAKQVAQALERRPSSLKAPPWRGLLLVPSTAAGCVGYYYWSAARSATCRTSRSTVNAGRPVASLDGVIGSCHQFDRSRQPVRIPVPQFAPGAIHLPRGDAEVPRGVHSPAARSAHLGQGAKLRRDSGDQRNRIGPRLQGVAHERQRLGAVTHHGGIRDRESCRVDARSVVLGDRTLVNPAVDVHHQLGTRRRNLRHVRPDRVHERPDRACAGGAVRHARIRPRQNPPGRCHA